MKASIRWQWCDAVAALVVVLLLGYAIAHIVYGVVLASHEWVELTWWAR